MEDESFGAWLRRMRLDKGLTQEVLGERIGAKHSTIQRYEAGTRNVPFDVMLQLADALGVPRSRAVAAWVIANGGELGYEYDPDTDQVAEFYEGLARPSSRRIVKNLIRELREAEREGTGDRTVMYPDDQSDSVEPD